MTRKEFKERITEALEEEGIEFDDLRVYDAPNKDNGEVALTIFVQFQIEPGLTPEQRDTRYSKTNHDIKEVVLDMCPIERTCQVLVSMRAG